MKLCFVLPPFAWDYQPNLGIAYLRSILQSKLPGIKITEINLGKEFISEMITCGSGISCEECPSTRIDCSPPLYDLLHTNDYWSNSFKKPIRSASDMADFAANIYVQQKYLKQITECYSVSLQHYIKTNELNGVTSRLKIDVQRILSQSPTIIAFSLLTNYQWPYAVALAKMIKMQADIPVLFGGASLGQFDSREILQTCPFVDYVFRGDGEEALPAFIRNFETKTFDTVPNLTYRADSEIRVNEQRDITDLNSLPLPDFGDDDLQCIINETPLIPIQASRDCYWGKCAFCQYDSHYRTRNVVSVVDEMEVQAKRYGINQFIFLDDSFSPCLLEEISSEILRRKLQIYYIVFHARPEKALKRELLQQAYISGLRCISFGVETITQRLLDKINKGTQAKHIEHIISVCEEIGIQPLMNYIVGLPTQTKAELMQELPFIAKHIDSMSVWEFTLMKDSSMCRCPISFDIAFHGQRDFIVSTTGTIHSNLCDFKLQSGIHPPSAKKLILNETPIYGTYFYILRVLGAYLNYGWGSGQMCRDILTAIWKHLYRALRSEHTAQKIPYLFGTGNMVMKNYTKALEQFQDSLRRAKNPAMQARIHFYKGYCFLKCNEYTNAFRSFHIALSLCAHSDKLHEYLAEAYYHLGNYEQALVSAQRSIALGNDRESVRLLVEKCERGTGIHQTNTRPQSGSTDSHP
jgi:hypothetical protein